MTAAPPKCWLPTASRLRPHERPLSLLSPPVTNGPSTPTQAESLPFLDRFGTRTKRGKLAAGTEFRAPQLRIRKLSYGSFVRFWAVLIYFWGLFYHTATTVWYTRSPVRCHHFSLVLFFSWTNLTLDRSEPGFRSPRRRIRKWSYAGFRRFRTVINVFGRLRSSASVR